MENLSLELLIIGLSCSLALVFGLAHYFEFKGYEKVMLFITQSTGILWGLAFFASVFLIMSINLADLNNYSTVSDYKEGLKATWVWTGWFTLLFMSPLIGCFISLCIKARRTKEINSLK